MAIIFTQFVQAYLQEQSTYTRHLYSYGITPLLFLLFFLPYTLQAASSSLVTTFLSHREGTGIGYDKGFTSLECLVFPTLFCNNRSLWSFVDAEAHLSNDGNWAANAGLGIRFIPCNSPMIIGCNLFYDFRESSQDFDYHQVGFGLELLNCSLDVRLNAYFPLDRERVITSQFQTYPGGYFMQREDKEVALPGASLEFGTSLPTPSCFSAYTALGAYVYKDTICQTAFGGSFRFSLVFNSWLYAEANLSYDPLFAFRANGEIGIQFSFGGSCKSDTKKTSFLPYQPIYRNQMIVLDRFATWDYNF